MEREDKQDKLLSILHRERPPYYHLLGLHILDVSENFAKLKLTYSDQLVNPYGFVNGGIIAALADAAVANALLTAYPDQMIVTIDFQLHLLRAAKSTLYAEGSILYKGKEIAVSEATIKDEQGKLVAKGTFTYAVKARQNRT